MAWALAVAAAAAAGGGGGEYGPHCGFGLVAAAQSCEKMNEDSHSTACTSTTCSNLSLEWTHFALERTVRRCRWPTNSYVDSWY